MMDRRAFIYAVAGGVLAPLAAEAQPAGKMSRVGVFHVGDHSPPGLQTLRDGLRARGYEEGRNIQLDFRNLAEEEAARRTAREFAQVRLDLIVAFGNPAVRAAKAATSEIPIVMIHVTDPVAQGFVKTLARPGGNLTGFVFFAVSPAKQVELFKEMVPGLRRVLVLIDPHDPGTPSQLAEIRKAAEVLKLKLTEQEATDQAGLERVFGSIKREDIEGVVPASNNLHIKYTTLLIRLASEKRVPLASYRVRGPRRALFLCARRRCGRTPRRDVCGQDPQGRQARRSPRRAAHQVRAGHQPQDRQGPRLDHSAVAPAARADEVIE
jgi:putative ABC transport system substrate-binding protein